MIRLVVLCFVLSSAWICEGKCGECGGGETGMLKVLSSWGECRRRQRGRQACDAGGDGDVTPTPPPITLPTTVSTPITTLTPLPTTPPTTVSTLSPLPTTPPVTISTFSPLPTTTPTVKPIPDRDEADEDVSPFDEVSKQIIDNDKKAVEMCLRHGEVKVKEMFLIDGYRLKYYIPDLAAESITASVRHRALRVSAARLLSPRPFADVEILPEIVDPAKAQWSFEAGVLTILVPYRVPFNKEIDKTCTMNIHEREIAVEEFTEEIDIRFSNSAATPVDVALVFPEDDG